jgi:hypothetical protein
VESQIREKPAFPHKKETGKMCFQCDETGRDTTCELAKILYKTGKAFLDYKKSDQQDLVSYADTLHAECIILLDMFVQLHHNNYVKDKQAKYRDILTIFWNYDEVGMNHEVGYGFGVLFNKDGSWSTHS